MGQWGRAAGVSVLICLGSGGVLAEEADQATREEASGEGSSEQGEASSGAGNNEYALPESQQRVRRRREKSSGAELLGAALEQGYQGRPEDQPAGSYLSTGLAIVPGVLVHGIGHYVADDKTSAWRLFWTELGGIALVVAGQLMPRFIEDSAKSAAPMHVLTHAGTLLFFGSWFADVLGSYLGAEELWPSTAHLDGQQFRLAYRYTNDPLTSFRHHIVTELNLHLGRFYVKPALDLEASKYTRRIQLDFGGILHQGTINPHNFVALGLKARRIEIPSYGLASRGIEAYTTFKGDIGDFVPSVKGFYLVGRFGFGLEQYQFADDVDRVPDITGQSAFTDNYLVIETGFEWNTSPKTRLTAMRIQDPTQDVAPISADTGLYNVGLTYSYSKSFDIELNFTLGDGWVLLLGLDYGL